MRRGLIPVCAWICRSETPSASSKSTRARRTSPAERLVVRSICSKRSRSVGCSRKASWEVNMNSHIPYIASCVTYLCNTTLEAEKKFRRIKGYQELLLLKERLNPSRIQQKEVRTVEVA